MKFIINKFSVIGTKSIDKTIELLFTNKTIKNDSFYENSNVKAIYGPNGSGKSGIMSSMYIYKRLIEDINGLNDNLFNSFVYETINKSTKLMILEVVFTVLDEEKNNATTCLKHRIELTSEDEVISIKKEEILGLCGKSINDDNFKPIIITENGALSYIDKIPSEDFYNSLIYKNSLNLLDKHSISFIIWKLIKSYEEDKLENINSNILNSLVLILLFARNVVVELNNEDIHYDYILNKSREKIYDNEEKLGEYIRKFLLELSPSDYLINLSSQNRDIIDEKDLDKYEENILKLTEFIKIFKPDLDRIDIDKKIYNNKYYCDKIFIYKNTHINIEFESTGIKKLVKLYYTLKSCANGAIAFIDEMDANLHDVYFTKLIDFFKNDSNGQLCFTTHNLEPIEVLKANNHSLDFISNDSRIYSWTKDGHKSPMNKYVNGLIPFSPFNVESFDFDILLKEEN